MAGVSIWWPTPVRPERHFTAEQLDASDRHHRPVRRATVLAMVARVWLLLAAAGLAGVLLDDGDRLVRFDDDLGWLESLVAPRVLVGAGLTVVALRIPSILADGWFEFRFRRGEVGYRPVPLRSFIATSAALTLLIWGVMVALAGLSYRYAVADERWPVALGGAMIAATVLSMVGERWVRSRLPGGEQPLDLDVELGGSLDRLAESFAIDQPTFTRSGTGFVSQAGAEPSRSIPEVFEPEAVEPTAIEPAGRAIESPNAYAVGLGPFRRVALNDSLLDEDRATIQFVVAHELAHLARRHLEVQTVLRLALKLTTVAAVAVLVDRSLPWSALGLSSLDPLGLPVLAIVLLVIEGVARPIESWASRVQERSADADAIAVVGPLPPDAARRLYAPGIVDLDPPGWVQSLAEHPSPPERLEFLARHRR